MPKAHTRTTCRLLLMISRLQQAQSYTICMHQSSLGQEFTNLATIVSQIVQDFLRQDSISQIWTASGQYTTSSAYSTRFIGSYGQFAMNKISAAHAEPKCGLFSQLVLHNWPHRRPPELEGWPRDPLCQLCLRSPETVTHLCKGPFTSAVHSLVLSQQGAPLNLTLAATYPSIDARWESLIMLSNKDTKRRHNGHIIYINYVECLERNMNWCIFNGSRMTYIEVAHRSMEDIMHRDLAFNREFTLCVV